MPEPHLDFIDAEAYLPNKEGTTIKDIIFAHLGKISTISTKEFTRGYWQKKPVATSGGFYMTETYHEDLRKAYINSVEFLWDLLLPKFDKDEVTSIENINKKFVPDKTKDTNDIVDDKLINRREIFREISRVLKRLNYMEGSVIK